MTCSDYELGRLYHAQGLWKRAREEYDLVLTGKHLETSTKKGKGKVSLQVSCHLISGPPSEDGTSDRARSRRLRRLSKPTQNMAVLRSNAGLQLLREQGHY